MRVGSRWATPPVVLSPFAEADHSLLKRLNLIDLSLSQGALEDRLLGEVLHVERPEILKNQQILYLGILQLEGKLEATEVIPWTETYLLDIYGCLSSGWLTTTIKPPGHQTKTKNSAPWSTSPQPGCANQRLPPSPTQ